MFLKVPEGFQRKKISSCPDTLLLPNIYIIYVKNTLQSIICRTVWSADSLRSHVANVLHNNTQGWNSGRNISGPKWEVANLYIFNFVPSHIVKCTYSNRMEDAIDAFKMIFDGKQSWLLGWTVVFMVSVAFFNYAGP